MRSFISRNGTTNLEKSAEMQTLEGQVSLNFVIPIYGCHVNMEKESFYNRFKCAIIIPLKHAWSVRDTVKSINAQGALVGIGSYWDIR